MLPAFSGKNRTFLPFTSLKLFSVGEILVFTDVFDDHAKA
jgi:hypothetical protein